MIKMLPIKLSKYLIYKYLFFKYFGKFLFLHKPLCQKYQKETIKAFGFYICRSCLFLYYGLALGFVPAVMQIKSVEFNKIFFIGLFGAFLTLLVSYPPFYKHFSRISRDFIRFYDGLFLGIFIALCFKLRINTGIAGIVLFLLVKKAFNKKRNPQTICAGCKELVSGKVCSGYIEQHKALLKIDEDYSNIITELLHKKGALK